MHAHICAVTYPQQLLRKTIPYSFNQVRWVGNKINVALLCRMRIKSPVPRGARHTMNLK